MTRWLHAQSVGARPLVDPPDIRVISAKMITMSHRWCRERVCDSFWRLYVNDRHGASLHTDGREVKMPAGRVYLVPAWTWFRGVVRRPVGHFYIHFDWVGLSSATIQTCFGGLMAVKDRARTQQIVDHCIPAFIDAHDEPMRWALLAQSIVSTALVDLLDQLSARAMAQLRANAFGDELIDQAITVATTHADRPPTVRQLAAQFNLTPTHLIRRFRAATGQTPGQFLLDHRIRLAASLLIQSDDTIDAIADQTGFADRFHFSKMFKRKMGVAPGRYRMGDLDVRR